MTCTTARHLSPDQFLGRILDDLSERTGETFRMDSPAHRATRDDGACPFFEDTHATHATRGLRGAHLADVDYEELAVAA